MRGKFFLLSAILLSVMMFSVTILAQQNFTVSLIGAQENPPVNTSGRGTCLVTLNTAETLITISCTYSGLTSPANAAHIHNNGPVGVNGPVRFPLNPVSGTSGTIGPLPIPVTPADVADLRAKRMYVNIHTPNFPGGEIRGQVKISTTPYDLDGDGRTDIAVFRQSNNTVYSLLSINNTVIGSRFGSGSGDVFLSHSHSSDFDGDGRGDPLIIKPNPANGDLFWSILQTQTNSVRTILWGSVVQAINDRIVPADYDGDGKQDIAIFRRATGFWYIIESSTNKPRVVQNFGAVGDIPSVGDFDKDGKADLTVVRAESGQWAWYTQLSSNGQNIRVLWGATTDAFPLFGYVDVDGDGAQDRMTVRNVNGQSQYNILRSSDNAQVYITWGAVPGLLGDYDGDGKTDFVARRDVNGQLLWQILLSSNNYNTQQARYQFFGLSSDQ